MNFFDDFEIEDNAIIGGIAGFVEESIEKEQIPKENDEPDIFSDDIPKGDTKNDGLRLLYNQNPRFALHIVNRFLEHKKISKINVEFKTVIAEIEDEIEQMREDEENADKNDC